MLNPATTLLLAIGMLSLGACNRQPASPAAKTAHAPNPIEQDVKQMQYDIRLAAAEKRIEELERQVGALESTPEKLDLDLLTHRVIELEAKLGGAPSLPSTSGPAAASPPSNGSEKRANNSVLRKAPSVPSKLNLPSLENRSQVGATDGAKALSSGK